MYRLRKVHKDIIDNCPSFRPILPPIETPTKKYQSYNIKEFKALLAPATKKSYFIFNGKLYKQVDEFFMGSSLGRILANAFLLYFKENC